MLLHFSYQRSSRVIELQQEMLKVRLLMMNGGHPNFEPAHTKISGLALCEWISENKKG